MNCSLVAKPWSDALGHGPKVSTLAPGDAYTMPRKMK